MVEGMYAVVNEMLSLMSVMSPPTALFNLSAHTVVKLCTLGVFALGVRLVSGTVMISAFCICVVNKQFELLKIFLTSTPVSVFLYSSLVCV